MPISNHLFLKRSCFALLRAEGAIASPVGNSVGDSGRYNARFSNDVWSLWSIVGVGTMLSIREEVL